MTIKKTQFHSLYFGKFEYPESGRGWIEQNKTHVYYPLEWLILANDQENRKMLLLCRDLVNSDGFANCPLFGRGYITSWKDSFIRKWLNEYFFNNAFNDEQKSVICTTYISPNKRGHSKTLDRVFLLSEEEYKKYLTNCSSIVYKLSITVNSSSSIKIEEDEWWAWWLRDISPDDDSLVEVVSGNGDLYFEDSNSDEVGIRPAIWIKY